VLGIPLELTAVEEGSAYGAALLAGDSAGVFADVHEAVATCVRVRDRIDPEPDWIDAYAAEYERFRALYPALRAVPGGQAGDRRGTDPGQTGDRPGSVPETWPVRT
jgi:xylulokinase